MSSYTTLFEITWLDAESRGYTDVLSTNLFGEEATTDVSHEVRGPKGGSRLAKCRVSVQSGSAELNYEAFAEYNLAAGNYLGVMRLCFSDADRLSIDDVFWREYTAQQFHRANVVVDVIPAKTPLGYVKPNSESPRVTRSIRERPGQMNFRRNARYVYGNRCCLTGCHVAEVLEAAHIDPYINEGSDHPQNALLLRRDLHALFDAGLLAIEPESHVAHVASSAREYPEYDKLHGKVVLSQPEAAYIAYSPSVDAISRRWNAFTSVHMSVNEPSTENASRSVPLD